MPYSVLHCHARDTVGCQANTADAANSLSQHICPHLGAFPGSVAQASAPLRSSATRALTRVRAQRMCKHGFFSTQQS